MKIAVAGTGYVGLSISVLLDRITTSPQLISYKARSI